MTTIVKETSSVEIPPSNPNQSARIEDLAFVKARLPFLSGQPNSAFETKRARDRTTLLVRRWQDVSSELKIARIKTLEFCEARPGKGDVASLVIVDREEFDAYQAVINEHVSELVKIGDALRRLDEMGAEWYDDLSSQIQIHDSTERNERSRISQMCANYVQRRKDLTPEETLKLPEVIEWRTQMEQTIADSAKTLEILRPQLEAMKSILEAVGC